MAIVRDVLQELQQLNPDEVIAIGWYTEQDIKDKFQDICDGNINSNYTLSEQDLKEFSSCSFDMGSFADDLINELEAIHERKVDEEEEALHLDNPELWDTE